MKLVEARVTSDEQDLSLVHASVVSDDPVPKAEAEPVEESADR